MNMKPLMNFALALLQSCPYQVSGSSAGGSENHLSTLSARNATRLRQPGLRESRKMAEALVLPAFLLMQLLHLSPCLFFSSFWIARASRCLAIGSSGKVNADPDQIWKKQKLKSTAESFIGSNKHRKNQQSVVEFDLKEFVFFSVWISKLEQMLLLKN